jgi:hypothetical protein
MIVESSIWSHRGFRVGAGAAALGGVTLVAGAVFAGGAVAASYLAAYSATVAVVVGMLLLIMMAHRSGAVWFVLLRRRAEMVVAALPALAVLAIPLLFIRHWFVARTVLYWIIWIGVGASVRRMSGRRPLVSVIGLLLAAPALTFAAFDWMMSLSPGWSSSVYGVYYFSGAIATALALLALLARSLEAPWAPTTEHFQAIGRLTLAFVLFWAYLWYVQFFIIWIGDIPREAAWYAVRLSAGWELLTVICVVTAFVVPFLVLVFRAARGSARVMPAVGDCILVAHYLDVYWLIVPSMRPAWAITDLIWDAAALAFIVGSVTAVAAWRQATMPAVASEDPLLKSSLAYDAH